MKLKSVNYYLEDICCLCLSHCNKLFDILNPECNDDLTNLQKITSSLVELSTVMETNCDYKICESCCKTVDMIYSFNEMCLKNIRTLTRYKTLLRGKKKGVRKQNLAIKLNTDSIVKVKTDNLFKPKKVNIKKSKGPKTVKNKSNLKNCQSKLETKENQMKMKKDKKKNGKIFYENFETVFLDETEINDELEEENSMEDCLALGNENTETDVLNISDHPTFNNTNAKEDRTNEKPHNFTVMKISKVDQSAETKLFTCHICTKSFNRRDTVNRHIQAVHFNIRPYQCCFCKKKFKEKSHLKEHEFLHSDKPYTCSQCNGRFSKRYELAVHKKFHTGETVYQCNDCKKTFVKSFSLKLHRCSHTQKPNLMSNR